MCDTCGAITTKANACGFVFQSPCGEKVVCDESLYEKLLVTPLIGELRFSPLAAEKESVTYLGKGCCKHGYAVLFPSPRGEKVVCELEVPGL